MSELDSLLGDCSFNSTRIGDDQFQIYYNITYPSFCNHSYPDDNNDYRNVFSHGSLFKLESWFLANHIEVDYDASDVYNEHRSNSDTYHSVTSNCVIIRGQYSNGKKYYFKAYFDRDDNVLYAKLTYSSDISPMAENQMIKDIFGNFPQ